MTLTEERMQILRLLEQGTITADDAAKLLAALEAGEKKNRAGDAAQKSAGGGGTARWLRVRVTDQGSGKRKVNINLPMGLVNVAMKMGAKFAPEIEGLDMEEIIEAIQSGAQGKVIDIEDDEDNERVEIFVE